MNQTSLTRLKEIEKTMRVRCPHKHKTCTNTTQCLMTAMYNSGMHDLIKRLIKEL